MMKTAIAFVTLMFPLGWAIEAQLTSIETKNMNLSAAPLRVALSKIAPLEEWEASWPNLGPRVCWRFFRPKPQQLDGLMRIINGFQGHTRWHVVDNCLGAGTVSTALPGRSAVPSLSAPAVVTQLSEADAASDLAALAAEIEKRFALRDVNPMAFSEELLTREGLRKSRGPFEDFQDGGQRIAYLIVNPGSSSEFQPRETDIMLHFEPGYDEMPAIFGDIVGIDLSRRHLGTLTSQESERIERDFPVLWKIADYYQDAYLTPQDVELLSQECAALEKILSSPKALRGLDKLSRIARWAAQKNYGVLFSAP